MSSFRDTLLSNEPPAELGPYLQSLWYDANGKWEKAHHVIQEINDKNAAWIHAYLHRKEGDVTNADYWYERAGKKRPSVSLEKEWESLVIAFD
ncbi:MAG: hypothetical protein ABJA57_05175 [Ginsengibacter sp.]